MAIQFKGAAAIVIPAIAKAAMAIREFRTRN